MSPGSDRESAERKERRSAEQQTKSVERESSRRTSSGRLTGATHGSERDRADRAVVENLEPLPWYHGFVSRDDVTTLLKHNGDFIVRSSMVNDKAMNVISIYCSKKGKDHGDPIRHFIFGHKKEGWFLNDKGPFAPNIPELVEMHKKGRKPIVTAHTEAMLINGVAKADWELDHDDIVLESVLGKGAFGEVWRGKLLFKGSTKEVAVKTCTRMVTKEDLVAFTKEARIMRAYCHPNVIRLIGLAARREPLYIVMELATGGSLLSYLKKHWPGPEEGKQLRIILEVAKGMEYLESKNCIHRDLAARNCLLDAAETVKISDFGLSSIARAEQVTGGMRLPVKWTAPEALADCAFSSKSDVWSFGILVTEVWTGGSDPYPGKTTADVRKGIFEGLRTPVPDQMPAPLKELVGRCWQMAPGDRPTFAAIRSFLNSRCPPPRQSRHK